MQDIWITDIMTKEVVTCSPETSLNEVVKQLHNQQFSCLIIINQKEPVGIITERDMVTILADLLEDVSWDSLAVSNFMTQLPTTILEDNTLFEAVDIMRSESIRHAPVVSRENHLIGLLTQTDIINGYYQTCLNED